MLLFCSWLSIFITTFLFVNSVKKIVRGTKSIILITEIAFYIVQIIPFILILIFNFQDDYRGYPNVYRAINDNTVRYIYCIFILAIMLLLHYYGKKYLRKHKVSFPFSNTQNIMVDFLIFLGMFLPVLGVLLAPNPLNYFTYSFFQTHNISRSSMEYVYHNTIIRNLNYIAFFCAVYMYFRKSSRRKYNNLIGCSIIIYSWIDGKRALFCFSLIAILLIDWLKKEQGKNIKLLKKGFIFLFIIVIYFVFNGNISGKSDINTDLINYELYFSRMSSVMTSIYDVINNWEILDYHGQSLLYNIFFFIPRLIWANKPVMFCKYYTAFAMDAEGLQWNLLVNMWTEFISNFGFFGPILAFCLIVIVARLSEKDNDKYVFLSGTAFCVFYTVFGFELLTTLIYLLWIVTLIRVKWRSLTKIRLI